MYCVWLGGYELWGFRGSVFGYMLRLRNHLTSGVNSGANSDINSGYYTLLYFIWYIIIIIGSNKKVKRTIF